MQYPSRVTIVEVGPRDGFQVERTFIPTELKVEVVDAIARAGVRKIETSSFVSPKFVPQLADAAELFGAIERQPGTRYTALVIALAFGCPFEGPVSDDRVAELAHRFVDMGIRELSIADSVGLGNPAQISKTMARLRAELDGVNLSLHLHDTRGLGLANVVAALEVGIDTFDASIGGLGGCPVLKNAAGNIATEDLANMCEEMGIDTGVDIEAIQGISIKMQDFLGHQLPSRVLTAGTPGQLYAKIRKEPE